MREIAAKAADDTGRGQNVALTEPDKYGVAHITERDEFHVPTTPAEEMRAEGMRIAQALGERGNYYKDLAEDYFRLAQSAIDSANEKADAYSKEKDRMHQIEDLLNE